MVDQESGTLPVKLLYPARSTLPLSTATMQGYIV